MAIAHRTGSPYIAYPSNVATTVSVVTDDLIVVMGSGNTIGSKSCSDTESNYYRLCCRAYYTMGGQACYGHMWYATAKSTATLTITMTTCSDPGMSVHVYSGCANVNPLHTAKVGKCAEGTSEVYTDGILTEYAQEVMVAYFAKQNTPLSSITAQDSWVERTDVSAHIHASIDIVTSSAATTYTAHVTESEADEYLWMVAAFYDDTVTDNLNDHKYWSDGSKVFPKDTIKWADGSIFTYYVEISGGTTDVASVAWGYSTATEEQVSSWSTWKKGDGSAISVSSGEWGSAVIDAGDSIYSNVVFMDAGNKTFTVTANSYESGDTPTIYIRGDTTEFLWNAETPSWTAYTTPVEHTWTYVQLKLSN